MQDCGGLVRAGKIVATGKILAMAFAVNEDFRLVRGL